MEVFECIKKRRSCRDFQTKEVNWDKVSLIVDAGRLAPSAGNLQNWKFIVVLDGGKRQSIADACVKQQWMAKAPVHIIILGEPEKGQRFYGDRGENLYTAQNCAAAAQNMMLEATNLGLASCWVGAFEEEKIRRTCGIPKDVTPYAIVVIGYAHSETKEPAKFPIETVTYFNGWRSKIRNVPAYFYYYGPDIQKGVKKTKEVASKASKTAFEKAKEVAEKIKEKLKERKSA